MTKEELPLKVVKTLGNLLLEGDESSPHAKVSMHVASRKSVWGNPKFEVSGTAKVGR